MAIGVCWWMTAPFCAVKVVGIANPAATVRLDVRVTFTARPPRLTVTFRLTVTVFVKRQRFVFAASAENCPCGSVSWNDPIGASGTV